MKQKFLYDLVCALFIIAAIGSIYLVFWEIFFKTDNF